eukprot:Gb_37179 [translate_table: standard]
MAMDSLHLISSSLFLGVFPRTKHRGGNEQHRRIARENFNIRGIASHQNVSIESLEGNAGRKSICHMGGVTRRTSLASPCLIITLLARNEASAEAIRPEFYELEASGGVKALDIRVGDGPTPQNGDKIKV